MRLNFEGFSPILQELFNLIKMGMNVENDIFPFLCVIFVTEWKNHHLNLNF